MSDFNLQEEADRLISQGLTTGQMLLSNGRLVSLTDSAVMRLLALVKTSKVVNAPLALSALIPDDFSIPTIEYDQGTAMDKEKELEQNSKAEPQTQPKAIDFEELERQINKNTNPDK